MRGSRPVNPFLPFFPGHSLVPSLTPWFLLSLFFPSFPPYSFPHSLIPSPIHTFIPTLLPSLIHSLPLHPASYPFSHSFPLLFTPSLPESYKWTVTVPVA